MLSHIVYFLTGGAKPPAYALDHLGRIARKERALGPNGGTGALVAPCAGSAEYLPDRQRWLRIGGTDDAAVWLGVDLQEPPKPDDLARTHMRQGHQVKLADGNMWEIPVARLALGGIGLPKRRVLNEDGTRGWQVETAYKDLSDLALRVWAMLNGQGGSLSDEELDHICGEALSVNYRIHEQEALALGLLNDDAMRGILRALVDYPTIERLLESEKKAASPTTTAG